MLSPVPDAPALRIDDDGDGDGDGDGTTFSAVLAQWAAPAAAASGGSTRRKLGSRLGPRAMPVCRPAAFRWHRGGHLGNRDQPQSI